jgi:hypothetical protein
VEPPLIPKALRIKPAARKPTRGGRPISRMRKPQKKAIVIQRGSMKTPGKKIDCRRKIVGFAK